MRRIQVPRRPCDVENPEDFHAYYSDSIVGIRDGQSFLPYRYEGQPVRGNFVFSPISDLPMDRKTLQFRALRDEVSFGSPDYGMVNVGPTTIYTYVTAIRHPHRGFRPALTNFTIFNTWEVRKQYPDLTPTNPEVAKNLFNPSFYGPEEAVELLSRGERIGCALSPTIGLITKKGCLTPLITYRRHEVGYLQDNRAFISTHYTSARKILANHLNREVVVV